MRFELPLLTLTLFLALAAGNAWAEETAGNDTPDSSSQPSNIDDWDEDVHEPDNDWTFFGMGFESRQAASGASSAGGGASGAVSSIKKGGSRRGK